MANTYNFSNVFISYAHEDKAFVQRLNAALKARDYQTWIDEEDVAFSANISEEAKAGIEAAHTFIFVVSKASSRSKACNEEATHAASHNKRIVPIQYEEVKDGTMDTLPFAIKGPRWLNFTGNDGYSFDENVDRLIDVILKDLAYEANHTRYLVRAREWDKRNREASFLLQGRDASEAFRWLDSVDDMPGRTSPTELQREFILNSEAYRQDERQMKQQQRALRFVERRTLPAFALNCIIIWFYFYWTFPGHSAEIGRPGSDVLFELSFGVGITAGVILAALILYADELITIRYPEDAKFRFIGSFVYSFALASSVSGFLQAMTFGPELDLRTVFVGWIGFGLTAMLRATFKLRGWVAFFLNIIAITIMLNLTSAIGAFWEEGHIALFYFESYDQFYWLAPWMAVLISAAAYGWLLAEDIAGLWRGRGRVQKLKLRDEDANSPE